MKSSASPHYLVIVDDPAKCGLSDDATRCIISAKDYIDAKLPAAIAEQRGLRVINLCNDYEYLHTGYYCSLLAQARGHRCIPTVSNIVHANWKRLHRDSIAEIESDPKKMQAITEAIDHLKDAPQVVFCFGRSTIPALAKLARILFDAFRLPIIQVHFAPKKGHWKIKDIEPLKLSALAENRPFFEASLAKYIGSYWSKKPSQAERYWLAILIDKSEAMPPSDKKAIEKFIAIGRKKRFYVELIDKNQYDALLEYDALFIRTTTNVNHYTYRFSQKAAREDIPCLDDKESILLCCNKIFLHEMLARHKIPSPRTVFISRTQKATPLPEGFSFPVVLKIPDGSFSSGVFKADSQADFDARLQEMFKESELILVQEFLPSSFDWRIGVLENKPLFACKFYMARKHWQIYDHRSPRVKSGKHEGVPLHAVPAPVMKAALKATKLIGSGLYGVDIKEVDGKVYVIEINDNPSIDAGVEDLCEGDRLYEAIFDYFERQINL